MFDSRTIIGTNGMTSFWGTDNYFYYSKDDGFEVKKAGHSLTLNGTGFEVKKAGYSLRLDNSGVWVNSLPVNPIICGGIVGVDRNITNKFGYKSFDADNFGTDITRITHAFGSKNYIVVATIESNDDLYLDNTIIVYKRETNYFDIRGRSSNNAGERTPFSFVMYETPK